jgi:ABC-type sugar transport system substrate-binding protein
MTPTRKTRVLYLLRDFKNEHQRCLREAALAQAKQSEVALEVQSIGLNPIDEGRIINDVLAQEPPEVLILEPANMDGIGFVLSSLMARRPTSFILLYMDQPYVEELNQKHPGRVISLGVDQKAIGDLQAQQLLRFVPRPTEAIYVKGPVMDSRAEDRFNGFKQRLGAVAQPRVIGHSGWNGDEVASILALRYASNPFPAVISFGNDDAAYAGRRALREIAQEKGEPRTIADRVSILGVDGAAFGEERVRHGDITATVKVPLLSERAVAIAGKIVKAKAQRGILGKPEGIPLKELGVPETGRVLEGVTSLPPLERLRPLG